VSWARYPEEVVERLWRDQAARLVRVLGESGADSVAHALSPVPGRGSGVLVGESGGATLGRVLERLAAGGAEEAAARLEQEALRASASVPPAVCELMPVRTGRELLAEHVVAAVCCAVLDTAGGVAGLDWLDGPALLVGGVRRTSDLAGPVARLVDHADPAPLRELAASWGVRPDSPFRLP
jgi:hypothetical protein